MSSALIPGELVTDLDVLALDALALTDYGVATLNVKRRVAVHEWLRPRLEAAGLRPERHRTRRVPSRVYTLANSAWTPVTDAVTPRNGAGLTCASVFSPSNGAAYVGLVEPFRGVAVGLIDQRNTTAGVLAVEYWNGAWTAVTSLTDTTMASSLSFARGGLVTWQFPDDWMERPIDGVYGYYVRLLCASHASPAVVTELLPIGMSRLTYPVARMTLALLYEEASGANRGRWEEKAARWRDAANKELDVVLSLIKDEFDADNSGAVDKPVEASSVTTQVDVWSWERG